jgi:uncharacterized membrane protein
MESHLSSVFLIRLSSLKDLLNNFSISKEQVKDSISLWQDIIAHEFNLAVVNQVNADSLLL